MSIFEGLKIKNALLSNYRNIVARFPGIIYFF